jgi:hypothetical protein
MTRPIRTEFVYPPIPLRDCDWLATFEDADEAGPQGWGATREAAIADLLAITEEAVS